MNPLRQLFSVTAAPAATASEPEAVEHVAPRDAIAKMLEVEGCKPHADKDGNLAFERNSLSYLLIFSEKDPEYLRLLLPCIFKTETDEERAAAYEAANLTSAACKAAKITVEGNWTHAAIECFLASQHHMVPVVMRCTEALAYARTSFNMAYAMVRRR